MSESMDGDPAAPPPAPEGEEPAATPDGPDGPDGTPDGPERLSRRKLALILAPIVVVTIGNLVATAATPYLAARHPLLLIAIEARNRNLILARRVDFVPFLLVASARRMLTDPLYYLLGRYYGDGAIRWLEVKAGLGSYARFLERLFKRGAYPAIFLAPGPVICAMAGVVRTPFKWFMAANIAGTLAVVFALKLTGDAFSSPVESVVGFFNRNLLVTSVASVGLVILSVALGRLEGRMSIKEAQEGLEEASAEDGREPGPVGQP